MTCLAIGCGVIFMAMPLAIVRPGLRASTAPPGTSSPSVHAPLFTPLCSQVGSNFTAVWNQRKHLHILLRVQEHCLREEITLEERTATRPTASRRCWLACCLACCLRPAALLTCSVALYHLSPSCRS